MIRRSLAVSGEGDISFSGYWYEHVCSAVEVGESWMSSITPWPGIDGLVGKGLAMVGECCSYGNGAAVEAAAWLVAARQLPLRAVSPIAWWKDGQTWDKTIRYMYVECMLYRQRLSYR